MKSTLIFVLCMYLVSAAYAQNDDSGFASLFDGKTLNGWTSTLENPESFVVEEGSIVCRGGKAHLFYTGDVKDANFTNFELKLKIKTTKKSNSGVYFHTKYQEKGWPSVGFEAQVNSTHSDPKKTGSLYGIVNIYAPTEIQDRYLAKVDKNGEIYILQEKAPSTDGDWFDYHIIVKDNHIIIKVNGLITVDWTQPKTWTKNRRIGSGTIAFQAHDPTCEIYYKNIQIKVLD